MLWAVIIVLWGACLAIFLALARCAPLMEETEDGLVYVGRSPTPAATEHERNAITPNKSASLAAGPVMAPSPSGARDARLRPATGSAAGARRISRCARGSG